MRPIILAALTVLLAACAPARVKQVATKQAPNPATTCDSTGPLLVVDGVVQQGSCVATKPTPASVLSSSCPVYLVDGVVTPFTCDAPKKAETPKCDLAAPIFIVDGVLQSQPCGKPE